MNRRRRSRGYHPPRRGKKIQVNFLPVIVIICLSICAGYLTARYVVYPILGYEPTGLAFFNHQKETGKQAEETGSQTSATEAPETTATLQSSVPTEPEKKETQKKEATSATAIEDKVDVKEVAGYALQFGSYTTKEAAKNSLKQLKESGISAKIVKKDGYYKVIGEIFGTKEKAKNALSKLDKTVGAFITTVET